MSRQSVSNGGEMLLTLEGRHAIYISAGDGTTPNGGSRKRIKVLLDINTPKPFHEAQHIDGLRVHVSKRDVRTVYDGRDILIIKADGVDFPEDREMRVERTVHNDGELWSLECMG